MARAMAVQQRLRAALGAPRPRRPARRRLTAQAIEPAAARRGRRETAFSGGLAIVGRRRLAIGHLRQPKLRCFASPAGFIAGLD